jgi:NADH:ubiquinone oxidoreductase subunit 5 (subunit L)/multisubunit Na+/H+ antiporter MnhA subunit
MTGPLIGLAIPSVLFGLVNIPGVEIPGITNFTTWLGVRVVGMGDHHADGIDVTLAIIGSVAALLGLAVGWMIWGRDRDTQEERDRFDVPLLYPLLRRKYFVDDAALGLVGVTMGPIARFVNWTNTYVFDGIVNAVGGVTKWLGGLVYNGLDQHGVDGVFNGLSAVADSAGSSLRKMQTCRVQQYASGFVAGALILVILFVFVI